MLLCAPSGIGPMNGLPRPVRSAVVTKTKSAHTTGDECPKPGKGVFQIIFFPSPHSTGGFPFGADPVANGPRHCPHCSRGSTPWTKTIVEVNHAARAKKLFESYRLNNFWIQYACLNTLTQMVLPPCTVRPNFTIQLINRFQIKAHASSFQQTSLQQLRSNYFS